MIWAPQPGPQKALIDCPLPEIFYGGARGGGKTDGILGKYAIKGERYGHHFNAVFFRKEMPQQDDLIERSKEIYLPIGGEWFEQKRMFRLPHGGRIRFRPLENETDAEKYQGQNLTDAAVEEAGNYDRPAAIDKLHGALRSSHGVPIQLILTANPGGSGHGWIKSRYIDPAPGGLKILTRHLPRGREHKYVYIPSRLSNNRILLSKDPDYENRLYLVGSANLVKAWLEGDWNVVEGAYFDCWDTHKHVIFPFAIPQHWMRFRSGDWGSAKPFSFGWWAVVSDDHRPNPGILLPRGALVRYREWYGASSPNAGLKLHAEIVGQGLWDRERNDPALSYGVLDPAAFAEDGGPSIAERIYQGSGKKILFRRADNARVSQRGAMGGWDQMRGRLVGELGTPMIFCFSTCTDSIRTIPVLQHDQSRPEDLDTDAEDHPADEWRYACMSRPYIKKAPEANPMRGAEAMTMDEAWKLAKPKADANSRI